MTNSDEHNDLADKHKRNQAQRIAQIKRWVAYIESQPSDEWGPQLNSLIDSQLDAARSADVSSEQYQRIEAASRARSDDE